MADVHCADLGNECTFVATADSPEAMKEQVLAHAAEVHPELLENMTPETEAAIGSAIGGAFSG